MIICKELQIKKQTHFSCISELLEILMHFNSLIIYLNCRNKNNLISKFLISVISYQCLRFVYNRNQIRLIPIISMNYLMNNSTILINLRRP